MEYYFGKFDKDKENVNKKNIKAPLDVELADKEEKHSKNGNLPDASTRKETVHKTMKYRYSSLHPNRLEIYEYLTTAANSRRTHMDNDKVRSDDFEKLNGRLRL